PLHDALPISALDGRLYDEPATGCGRGDFQYGNSLSCGLCRCAERRLVLPLVRDGDHAAADLSPCCAWRDCACAAVHVLYLWHFCRAPACALHYHAALCLSADLGQPQEARPIDGGGVDESRRQPVEDLFLRDHPACPSRPDHVAPLLFHSFVR